MQAAPKTLATLLFILTVNMLQAATPLHSINFKLFGSKIFFTAHILDSNEITVLFDPGTYAYMHSGTAQKYRIDYTETGKMANSEGTTELNMFTNFGVAFDGFTDTFETVRSQATAPYLNKRIDMVLGKEWVDRYIVHIDLDNSKINLYDTKGFDAPAGFHAIETISWNRYPLLKAWFAFDSGDSAEVRVEINHGSEVGFQLDKYITNEYKLYKIQKDRGSMRLYGPTGEGIEGMLTRVPSVQIDGMRQTMVRGGLFKDGYSQGDGEFAQGLVGMDFLKWYNFVLDKWGGKLYYKPTHKE
ncbi:hypothetical protein GC194_01455 [bacterium]|nr:hypothetical protein [bacterium]